MDNILAHAEGEVGMSLSEGAFHNGEYRNVFKELGYTDTEIDQKLQYSW